MRLVDKRLHAPSAPRRWRSPFVIVVSLALDCGGSAATTPDAGAGDAGESDASAGIDASFVDGSGSTKCVPGRSIGCNGPGGCRSNQVCVADGTGYGPCECTPKVGLDAATLDGAIDGAPSPPVTVLEPGMHATFLAPTPNGVGITYDGQEMWLLASTNGNSPYQLVRFDPSTLVVDRSFTLASLYATLGTGAGGIAWDGVAIRIAVAGDTNAIVTVDASTGQITRDVSSPGTQGPVDLDFDGAHLWLADSDLALFAVATGSGGVVQQVPIPGPNVRPNGIAWHAGQLYVCGMFGGMELYDATSGADLGSVVHSNGTPLANDEVGPSVFVGDELAILANGSIVFYAPQSLAAGHGG